MRLPVLPGPAHGKRNAVLLAAIFVVTAACGDRCENLCTSIGTKLAACKPSGLTWNDLGARSRADFVNQCQLQWDRERTDLSASDLQLALEACRDTNRELGTLTCDEVLALYGPTE